MKIAGIAGAKHPTKKKGEAIELSPEQKVCAMAKEQLANDSGEGFKYIPLDAEVIGRVDTLQGRKIKGKEDPAQYSASVKVKFRKLRLSDDRLFPSESTLVKITCKDCKNDIGVPDLETVDFKITK